MIGSSNPPRPARSWRLARKRRVALLLIAVSLDGCGRRRDVGPVVVSVIGGPPRLADASRGPLTEPDRLLGDAVAQGLVRFDATGQIEPGIAQRWIVIDGGMSYIFRLRDDARWGDGKAVTAADVVAILKRQIAHGSRNPLLPFLSAIDDIVEMTPEVIEVRLNRPRPDLLKLFAQPELAVLRAHPPAGTGPFRILANTPRGVMLRPADDLARDVDDAPAAPRAEDDVELIGERASRAVLRFQDRASDLVSGGTFADWPLVTASKVAPANRRLDSAAGLFGLAIVRRDGFLADPADRAAIAAAIDRQAFVAALDPDWRTTATILPEQLDSAASPATPSWASPDAATQATAARDRVAAWRAAHAGPLTLRIALPPGPGATMLYGYVGAALLGMGIAPLRVGLHDEAELRLVDTVAPYDSARWYLATACQPCGAAPQTAIEAARTAPTLALRARQLAEADAALAADVAFIPIARPLRWSLVALRLRQWQGNSRAWHPLNRLRNDTQ